MSDKCILFVVNCLDIGGAEIQVARLATGMLRRGWRVGVVSLIKLGPLAEPLESIGVRVFTLHMRPGVPNPAAILRLRRIVREFRPRIVHSHIIHANLLSRITRLIAPMPTLVCTAHNLRESGRILELGYRYTDSLADLTTNVSQAGVDRYIHVRAAPANRIRFVPNGLDFGKFIIDPAQRARLRSELGLGDRFVWLAVGRFRVQKDYPNMLRAFASIPVSDACPPSILVIAGGGPTEAEAKALAVSLKVTDRVRFIGIRTDVSALMTMADAFLLSSAWEGMPLVLQEAAASSLPIVATDVGGNREVAIDGVSALLVPPRDAPALAAAMQKLLALSADERSQMGRAGRDHVTSSYDMEHVLDQWESVYAELSNGAAALNMKAVPAIQPARLAGATDAADHGE